MLPRRGNTVAIIPCLNEAAAIGAVVRQLHEHVGRVLVVDDGSTDTTAEIAEAVGAVVERHSIPKGKGAALAAGWMNAANSGAVWALLLDGDGQHDPADSPKFFAGALPETRLVMGNRMSQADAMPWVRRQTNRWMSRRISGLAGIKIPDSQCGYRLVHLPSLLSLDLRCRNYEIESEMVVAFARAGMPVSFVPIAVRYHGEQSKISPITDTIRWFRWYRAARRRASPVTSKC